MDGWMDRKGRWMVGRIEKKHEWLDVQKIQMDGWKEGYKIDGWLDRYKLKMDGFDGYKNQMKIYAWFDG